MSNSGSTTDRSSTPWPGGVVRQPVFVTTHWSVVLTAGRSDTGNARDALEKLCRTYWYPLYAYVRRRGHRAPDAQDLTQEFFARVFERNWIARAEQAKGRFRTFLLTALERFLANEWDKARALKRGGNRTSLSKLRKAVAQRRAPGMVSGMLDEGRFRHGRGAGARRPHAAASLRSACFG